MLSLLCTALRCGCAGQGSPGIGSSGCAGTSNGTRWLCAILCRIPHAIMMSHTFSGVYSRVPPAAPRHSHLPFSSPMQRSTVPRVRTCAMLYLRSCSVPKFRSRRRGAYSSNSRRSAIINVWWRSKFLARKIWDWMCIWPITLDICQATHCLNHPGLLMSAWQSGCLKMLF